MKNTRQYDLQDQYPAAARARSGATRCNGRLSIYRASTNPGSGRCRTTGGATALMACNNAVQLDYADLLEPHSRAPDRRPAQQRAGLVYPWPAVRLPTQRYRKRIRGRQRHGRTDRGPPAPGLAQHLQRGPCAGGSFVFSIAFEAPWRGQQVMRDCALVGVALL